VGEKSSLQSIPLETIEESSMEAEEEVEVPITVPVKVAASMS
jgi:hypothetical protein